MEMYSLNSSGGQKSKIRLWAGPHPLEALGETLPACPRSGAAGVPWPVAALLPSLSALTGPLPMSASAFLLRRTPVIRFRVTLKSKTISSQVLTYIYKDLSP